MLHDTEIRLRALEPDDIISLYEWENLSEFWLASATLAPYSHRNLMRYLDAYEADPFHSGQLRLMIETVTDRKPVGLVDLYNVEVRHRRADVGILIAPEYQRRGMATRALMLLSDYCRRHLGMHQLLAAVPQTNTASLALFSKAGFKTVAVLPHYIAGEQEGVYIDAVIMNKILQSRPN